MFGQLFQTLSSKSFQPTSIGIQFMPGTRVIWIWDSFINSLATCGKRRVSMFRLVVCDKGLQVFHNFVSTICSFFTLVALFSIISPPVSCPSSGSSTVSWWNRNDLICFDCSSNFRDEKSKWQQKKVILKLFFANAFSLVSKAQFDLGYQVTVNNQPLQNLPVPNEKSDWLMPLWSFPGDIF